MTDNISLKEILIFYRQLVAREKIEFLDYDDTSQINEIKDLLTNLFDEAENEDKGQLNWFVAHESGEKLWRNLISSAINSIDKSSKGNSKLYEYLGEATKFEDILYGMDEYYRDHTLHSLWVYFLGEYILRKKLKNIYNDLNWYVINDIDRDKNKYPDNIQNAAEELKHRLVEQVDRHKNAIWCIMSLCHDLGYSLSKLNDLNDKVNNVLKYFELHDIKQVGYSLDVEHQYIVNEFLEIMAADFRIVPVKAYTREEIKEENNLKSPKQDAEDQILIKCYREDSTYWRLCKALESREHGIISSYLMYKVLSIFAETWVRGPAEKWGLDDQEAVDNIIRGDILFAIAQHEFAFAHLDQMGSLADILVLADEMEEFSRYGRQLSSREYNPTTANVSVQFVNSNPTQGEHLEIEIIYTSKHKKVGDLYRFFVRKAKDLCKKYSINRDRESLRDAIKDVIGDDEKANYVWEFLKKDHKYIDDFGWVSATFKCGAFKFNKSDDLYKEYEEKLNNLLHRHKIEYCRIKSIKMSVVKEEDSELDKIDLYFRLDRDPKKIEARLPGKTKTGKRTKNIIRKDVILRNTRKINIICMDDNILVSEKDKKISLDDKWIEKHTNDMDELFVDLTKKKRN